MAGKYDEFDKLFYGTKSTSQQNKNQTSINNLKARLAAGGVNPDEALDNRNWLEKKLNLKQDQNAIFDVFEILNRPQQALFGGLESSQKGKGFLEGAKAGITGDKETEFKDILMNTGAFTDRAGKMDVVDILGKAGDIFLDPADIIPVAGFSKASDVLKAGGNLKDAYKATDSLTDVAFKGFGKAIKGTAKGADNLIEKGLSKLDEISGIKYSNLKDAVNSAGLLPEVAEDATRQIGRLENYKAIKDQIKDMFSMSKSAKNAYKAGKVSDASQEISRLRLGLLKDDNIVKPIQKYADKAAQNLDDAAVDVAMFMEKHMNRTVDNARLFDLAKKGDLVAYDEVLDTLNDIKINSMLTKGSDELAGMTKAQKLASVDEKALENGLDLSVKVENGKIKLGNGWKSLNANVSGNTTIGLNYTKDQLDRLNKLDLKYRYNTDGFRDLIDDTFGTSWWGKDSDTLMLREGSKVQALSKRQAAAFEPEVRFSGKDWNGDILDTTNKHTDNRLFMRGDRWTATGYPSRGIAQIDATAANIGTEQPLVYNLLIAKESPEKIKNLDFAGGSWSYAPESTYENLTTPKYYKQIPDDVRNELSDIYRQSNGSERKFAEELKKNQDLVDSLKTNKIDVISKDYPKGHQMYNDMTSIPVDNIDTHFLYELLDNNNGKLIDDQIDKYFKYGWADGGRHYTTDTILDTIEKDELTGRQAIPYNVINFQNIDDPGRFGSIGLDAITRNEGMVKDIGNRIPDLNSNNLYDLDFNLRMSNPANNKPGVLDLANRIIDETQGTNLAGKYDMFTNDNYIMPHTLTEEGQKIVDSLNEMMNRTQTKGNTHLLEGRKWFGSSVEVNNKVRDIIKENYDSLPQNSVLKKFYDNNSKFMEENFIKAFDNRYLDPSKITKGAKDVANANEILLTQTFGKSDEFMKLQNQIQNEYNATGKISDDLLKKYNELNESSGVKYLTNFDNKVPKGSVRVSNDEAVKLADKFTKMNNQFGLADKSSDFALLSKQLKNFKGDVAIDEDIWRMIKVSSDEKALTGLGSIYNKYLNTWKKWKTASPTFLLNNVTGNSTNLQLGGVSLFDQAKFGPKVKDIMENGEKYYIRKLAGDTLSKHADETANLWYEFRSMGFDNSALKLNELPEDFKKFFTGEKKLSSVKDYMTNGIPYLNNYLNNQMDTSARLMIMLKAKSDPSFLKKLGVDNTRDAISKIMFDPEMLTTFEKTKIKKLIPFYTYAKNNMMYHITNLGNNGTKYNRLMKTVKSLQKSATGGNEENMADYLKNNLYIPIPGLDENGNYTILRTQIPFGDVINTLEDPLGQIANMSSPLVKGLYEQASGIDTYSGNKIESFPGQKSKNINLFGYQPSKKLERAISNFSGLDVPLKTLSRLTSGDPLSAVRMQNNINTDRLSKTYDQIENLQNLMKQYEQKGYQFSTMSELKKANKNNTTSEINAIFAKYGIDTGTNKSGTYSEFDKLFYNK